MKYIYISILFWGCLTIQSLAHQSNLLINSSDCFNSNVVNFEINDCSGSSNEQRKYLYLSNKSSQNKLKSKVSRTIQSSYYNSFYKITEPNLNRISINKRVRYLTILLDNQSLPKSNSISRTNFSYNSDTTKHELGIAFIKNKKVKFYTLNYNNRYGEWSGKKKDGFVTGDGIMKIYENGSLITVSKCTYINGYREGFSFDSTQTYVFYGDYKNGKRNGKGKLTSSKGDVYEGDWANDMFDGSGIFTVSNGDEQYEGDWKENKRHGKGRILLKNGYVYEGDWKENERHGKGRILLKNGDVYEGGWFNDMCDGFGKYDWTSGQSYEGDWKENKKHGKGKILFKNGDIYEGGWFNDMFDGFGKFDWSNGQSYEGDWKENKINGEGKLTYFSGYEVEGNWENGKLIAKTDTKGQSFNLYNKKYITSLIDGGIDCISNKTNIYRIGDAPVINTSIIYDNFLFFGGEFNRIHGIPTHDKNQKESGSIVVIHNDSIFGFLETDGTKLIDFGVVYKFKIFQDNLFAATSKGLWKFSNGNWNKAHGDKILCNKECEVFDIEVFNDKLYCVLSCTWIIGTCSFNTKLMEFTGNGYVVLDSLNMYISEKNERVSLISTSQYLYFANDSSIFLYDGSVVKRIKHYVPQITLVYSKNKIFGIYGRRGSVFKTKYDKYFEIDGDSVKEIQIENELISSNTSIGKVSVFNNDIYIATNSLWKLPKGDATYMYKLSGPLLVQTKIINCSSCVLLHGLDKPINIYSNEGECDKIEERNNTQVTNSTVKDNKSTNTTLETDNSVTSNAVSTYKGVKIGNQVWMSQNLNVVKFKNGDPIPEAKTQAEWIEKVRNNLPTWCYYDFNPNYGLKFGKLYNVHAVNDPRGLAPEGWHVPTYNEWQALESYLGNAGGKKLKSSSGWKSYTYGGYANCTNCASWNSEYRRKVPCQICKDSRRVSAPKTTVSGNGSNSSGFNGQPGGYYYPYKGFMSLGSRGIWWSSTNYHTFSHWVLEISQSLDGMYLSRELSLGFAGSDIDIKSSGFSVRCIKD